MFLPKRDKFVGGTQGSSKNIRQFSHSNCGSADENCAVQEEKPQFFGVEIRARYLKAHRLIDF